MRKGANSRPNHIFRMLASMGPHFFKCGKKYLAAKHDRSLQRLQWGRTFSSAERRLTINDKPEHDWLQWGRTFSSAESAGASSADVRVRFASMGPHFFKCGKKGAKTHEQHIKKRFNGAALFQVRKAKIMKPFAHLVSSLQWGRTFSSAERPGSGILYGAPGSLQWGRTFSSAERQRQEGDWNIRRIASMGPHFFKCGKAKFVSYWTKKKSLLQWGRTFSSAERFCVGGFGGVAGVASMGPHFFKCGKTSLVPSPSIGLFVLQWGRTFSSAERKGSRGY